MMKQVLLVAVSFAALIGLSPVQAEVARSVVTSGVVEREPVDKLETVPAGQERVLFFTELRDMKGKSITHVWKHNDEVMAEVEFKVGGPRWRVWSSKNMMHGWAGDWQVSVVDEAGKELASESFSYAADASGMADSAAGMDMEKGAMSGGSSMPGDSSMSKDSMGDGEGMMDKEESDDSEEMGGSAPAMDGDGGMMEKEE